MFDELIASLDVLPDPETASAATLVDVAAVLHRFEAAVCAHKLGFAGQLLRCFESEPLQTPAGRVLDAFDSAEAELGPALVMTPAGASAVVNLAQRLASRLPNIWDAFRRGELDLHRVRIIVHATENVSDEHIKQVEYAALDRILRANEQAPLSGAKLRAVVDKVIAEVDADGLRLRRKEAEKGRNINVFNAPDGMAEVHGLLPAADAISLTNRLSEMAKRVCSDDPRAFAARRADALIALSNGQSQLACDCTNPECPYASGDTYEARRYLVHVVAHQDTIEGSSDTPGWIDGYGVIDADHVRQLSAASKLRIMAEAFDPAINFDQLTYRPSLALDDWARAVYGGCQFPGCNRAAWQSDLDHRDAYDRNNPGAGGKTRGDNLGPLCRKHHIEKTFGGWKLDTDKDGVPVLISRLGKRYSCPPTGPVWLLGGRLPCRTGLAEPPPLKRRTRAQQYQDRRRAERQQLRYEREHERMCAAENERHARLIDPGEPPPF